MTPKQGVLAIMGSGETAPTMAKVHREILDRLRTTRPPTAVLLDTPFGFQENADELCQRAETYFAESVGTPIEVASFRRREVDPVQAERAWRRVRQADYIFAGPGSPTYALSTWTGTPLADLLEEAVERGAAVVFSSAAALTLGVATVPVYEIYKVGEQPSWRAGLDVFGKLTGIEAALVPHFNNAEGGTHDTRFCYLGERRLSAMERMLEPDVIVLGVDEHTALIIDFAQGEAVVRGIGAVTLRWRGKVERLEAETMLGIDELVRHVRALQHEGPADPTSAPVVQAPPIDAPAPDADASRGLHPLHQRREALVTDAEAALAGGDPDGTVGAILALLAEVKAWAADTSQTDEVDQAEAAVRHLIVGLGDLATARPSSVAEAVAPLVDRVLQARAAARREREFAVADRLRDLLVDAGIEVQDHADGSTWQLIGNRLREPSVS